MVPIRPLRSHALALLSLLFVPAVAAQNSPGNSAKAYEEALARYRTCMDRLPFVHHTEGRTRLANTRKPEALQVLCADYEKAKDFPEYSRYTLANLFAQNFSNDAAAVTLEALRKANSKPVDTWLWANTLRIHADRIGDAEVREIATTSENVLHRAAAIHALGESRNGDIKSAIVTNCLEWPKAEADRCIMLGAMSGALMENKRHVNEEEYRTALTAYISLLAPEAKLTHTMQIQVARHLQKILNGPTLYVNPEPWLELLQRGDVKKKTAEKTAAQSRFFGIESDGERFCYVLDMSDSMCKLIAQNAKPAAATTGPRKRPKGVLPDESDLPWQNIKSRWDLAREQMRITLQRLTPDKHFSIVWFGSDSGMFASTKGMVKATKANVEKAIAELDSIKQGAAGVNQAIDGELKGKTNMHAGLRYAFSLSEKGYVDEVAYVDPAVLTDGCDTIFLLSDGAPSWDEFFQEDTNYKEGQTVVDTEYNKPAPDQPRTTYFGPYNTPEWILEDVRRMNAFRRIRMHCIGLGEADMSLLEKLAALGNGELYVFGRERGK